MQLHGASEFAIAPFFEVPKDLDVLSLRQFVESGVGNGDVFFVHFGIDVFEDVREQARGFDLSATGFQRSLEIGFKYSHIVGLWFHNTHSNL